MNSKNALAGSSTIEGGIAALDWALAETLLILGTPPSAVVAASDWARFVVEPQLPDTTADLGLQQELNFELLAALRPSLILVSPFLSRLEPQLKKIAKTKSLSIFDPGNSALSQRVDVTRSIGKLINKQSQAQTYISTVMQTLDNAAKQLGTLVQRPVVLATFIDQRHVRVYGGTSLYAEVLSLLGLENGWKTPTGYFGFSTVSIEKLAELGDVEFISFDPVIPGIEDSLNDSPIWREFPFVKGNNLGRLPAVLMFGGLPSASRFASLLAPYLTARWA